MKLDRYPMRKSNIALVTISRTIGAGLFETVGV